MRICVYPGSFDPVTNGHIDIVERATGLFDRVIVVVLVNIAKKPDFTIEERVRMLKKVLVNKKNVEVDSYYGLLADYMKIKGATTIIKGLRAVSDFEVEFQLALLNKDLNPGAETLFMMTSIDYLYLSSSIVKEIARYGGNIDNLVPEGIKDDILGKLQKKEG